MKKQFVKFLSLCVLGATTVFVSCDKNSDDEKPEVKSVKRVFFLNEGSMGANNSTLDVYYPDGESDYQSKVFAAANGQGLGDTGQDLLAYGNRIYVSVSGSNYLAKLDQKGKIVEQYSFTETDGSPRYLAVKDGFIYVSTYGGKVMKFDTAAIVAPKGAVEVGTRPEEICISGNSLYAVIAGDYNVAYDSTLAVVDLTAFSLKDKFTVAIDPTNVLSVGDKLCVIHYNTTTWAQEIMEVNPSTKESKVLCPGSKMATDGEFLYYVNSSTDWTTMQTTTFILKKDIFNLNMKADSEFLDLTSTPEIKTATIYLFEIDPDNGDFYVGTTDYKTNGTIYRFDKAGKFITKFETSGINPNSAAFVK